MRAVSTAAAGVRHTLGATAQAVLIAAIIAAMVLAASVVSRTAPGGAASALAAKGGRTAGTAAATVSSSCNPCEAGSLVRFTGSGYDASQPRGMASFRDVATGDTVWIGVNISSDGTTAFELYLSAGTYDVKVLQQIHRKMVLKAELDGLVAQ
jgi:hypothetical protein